MMASVSASASSTSAPPALLRLPAELRLAIYDSLWPTINSTAREPYHVDRRTYLDRGALLFTCRTIRSETEALFYARHIFDGRLSDQYSPQSQPFPRWLEAIGPTNLNLIPGISLTWILCPASLTRLTESISKVRLARSEWAEAWPCGTPHQSQDENVSDENKCWQNLNEARECCDRTCHEVENRSRDAAARAFERVASITGVHLRRLDLRPRCFDDIEEYKCVDEHAGPKIASITIGCQTVLLSMLAMESDSDL